MFTLGRCGGLERTEVRAKKLRKSQSFAHFQAVSAKYNMI